MDEVLNYSMNEMAGADFDCSCGRHHTLDIRHIIMGQGVLKELPKVLEPFSGKKVYMLSDNHTFEAAGDRVLSILEAEDYLVKNVMLDSGDDILIPNEQAVGTMFLNLEPDTAVIVAVGSGTINDMAKYMSARTKSPYVIVCTAPSMDGYVADGAPLILEGRKISFVATLPYGVIGDTDIMKQAPMHMIHAGFGDVLGKLTALADWYLAKENVDEYCCETCVTLVQRALDKVTGSAEALAKRDDDAVLYLIEALTLTGVAMGLIGVSRPASGAEHMLSHYWEMDFIAKGKFPELHGIKVGIATPVIAEIFEMMKDEVPEEAMKLAPSREYVEGLLKTVGAPVYPTDIGIDRELFYNSILEGYKVRNRYSILELALKTGRLEEIAEKITNRIYQ